MTHEEALHEVSTKVFRNTDDFSMTISKECYKKIIEALKKQIPEKPIMREAGYLSVYYDCPICGNYLVSRIDGQLCAGQKYIYCYKCGQALEWSDTE